MAGFLSSLFGSEPDRKENKRAQFKEATGQEPTEEQLAEMLAGKSISDVQRPKSLAALQAVAPEVARPTPTVEAALAKKGQSEGLAAPGADTGTKDVTSNIALPKAYQDLMNSYSALGVQQKKDLEASMKNVNSTIQELNDGFEASMAEAKTKAEKEKTRAEWASIASMLAKNIVGFAAAQQGVSPNAMAYETMDWGKRIADINANLKNDIDTLRDTMKEKVMAKRLEGAGAKDLADMDYRSKLAALEGRKDLLLAQERAQADKDKLAADKAKQDAITTKLEPPGKELDSALGIASDKKTFEKGIGNLKALAARYNINPSEIDSILQASDTGFLGIGAGNEMTPEAQNKIAQLFENKYRQLVTTKSSTGMADSTGQPAQSMVQSGGTVTVTDIASGKSKQYPANHPAVAAARNNPKFKVE